MPKRYDANLVDNITKFHELEFHIMRGRNESAIYFDLDLDLSKTLPYIEKVNEGKGKKKITLFHIILGAAVRTLALRPKLNRFVSNRRLWQRNTMTLAFVVKKMLDEDAGSVNAMIDFDPFETLDTISEKIDKHLYEARKTNSNENDKQIEMITKMPRFLIRFIFWLVRWLDERNLFSKFVYSQTKDMPMYSSAFLANLGSIGLPTVYHHLFEMGTIGFFLAIGKITKRPFVDQETGELSVRPMMTIRITLDDRISEGVYLRKAVDYLHLYIENPEELEKPLELSQKQLDWLKLKKYKKDWSKKGKTK
ncbi:2-oxo acid dehydrogenase subunit E2 [Candidatus Lokiarchaeum ossiferum]